MLKYPRWQQQQQQQQCQKLLLQLQLPLLLQLVWPPGQLLAAFQSPAAYGEP